MVRAETLVKLVIQERFVKPVAEEMRVAKDLRHPAANMKTEILVLIRVDV